jgi:outer membrane protein assembly factor BamB
MKNFRIGTACFVLGAYAAGAAAAASSNSQAWPQWRGPDRDGIHVGEAWPESLDKRRLTLMWRQMLDAGYSSPIVTTDRVFTVETLAQKEEVVRAFDRVTGKQLWKTQWDGAMKVPFFARANGSWARCTPAVDGNRLFVGGMRDVLACLDTQTGAVEWKVDFVERNKTPLPSFGFVSSPLVHGDHVYVQAGGGFMKLDKATGETIWKSMGDGGGMYGSAFSSPVIEEMHGESVALVQARTELAAIDLMTGRPLWKQPIKAFRGMNILTPIVHNDGLFTSAYGGRTSMFETRDTGEGVEVSLAWDNKLQGYMSTPVVVDGHAYLHLRNTRMACVKLGNGEITWTSKERFGKYMSMVAQGDKILALDQEGELILLKADPKQLRIMDRSKVSDEETWAHLAVADRQLFVRELRGISVYEWK